MAAPATGKHNTGYRPLSRVTPLASGQLVLQTAVLKLQHQKHLEGCYRQAAESTASHSDLVGQGAGPRLCIAGPFQEMLLLLARNHTLKLQIKVHGYGSQLSWLVLLASTRS